jgi:hypothetical protein
MPRVEVLSRVTAAAFFLMSALASGIALGLYLFYENGGAWRSLLEYALSKDNEDRALFVVMGIAGVFSLIALAVVAFARGRLILRSILIGGVVQSIAYAVLGGWFLALLSAMPLWWVYKVQHEI